MPDNSSRQLVVRNDAQDSACGLEARAGYYAAMTERERIEANLRRKITREELRALRAIDGLEAFA